MKIAWFNKVSTPKTPAGTEAERIVALEAQVRALRIEWEDVYERMLRAMRRLNKRARDQEARDDAEAAQDAPQPTISAVPGLDPISAAIHARRQRVSSGTNGPG